MHARREKKNEIKKENEESLVDFATLFCSIKNNIEEIPHFIAIKVYFLRFLAFKTHSRSTTTFPIKVRHIHI